MTNKINLGLDFRQASYKALLEKEDMTDLALQKQMNETKLTLLLLSPGSPSKEEINSIDWSSDTRPLLRLLLCASRPDIVSQAPVDWLSVWSVHKKNLKKTPWKNAKETPWIFKTAFSTSSVFGELDNWSYEAEKKKTSRAVLAFWEGVLASGAFTQQDRFVLPDISPEPLCLRDIALIRGEEDLFLVLDAPQNKKEAELSLFCALHEEKIISSSSNHTKKALCNLFETVENFDFKTDWAWLDGAVVFNNLSLGVMCLANARKLSEVLGEDLVRQKTMAWFSSLDDTEKENALNTVREISQGSLKNIAFLLEWMKDDSFGSKNIIKNEGLDVIVHHVSSSLVHGQDVRLLLKNMHSLSKILDRHDLKEMCISVEKKSPRMPLTSITYFLKLFDDSTQIEANTAAQFLHDPSPKNEIAFTALMASIDHKKTPKPPRLL